MEQRFGEREIGRKEKGFKEIWEEGY